MSRILYVCDVSDFGPVGTTLSLPGYGLELMHALIEVHITYMRPSGNWVLSQPDYDDLIAIIATTMEQLENFTLLEEHEAQLVLMEAVRAFSMFLDYLDKLIKTNQRVDICPAPKGLSRIAILV